MSHFSSPPPSEKEGMGVDLGANNLYLIFTLCATKSQNLCTIPFPDIRENNSSGVQNFTNSVRSIQEFIYFVM